MKKFLAILLSCLTAFSLFACTSDKTEEEPKYEPITDWWWIVSFHEAFIQAEDGTHVCLWEDGTAAYERTDRPAHKEIDINAKHASLSLYTEYDMWFNMAPDTLGLGCLDFTNDYWYVKFDYDETKFEIKPNPEKENHFIITALQSCDNEKIGFTLREKHPIESLSGKMLEPVDPLYLVSFSITASASITIIE